MENRNVWIGVGVAAVAVILLLIWSPWSDDAADETTTTTASAVTTTTAAEETTTSAAEETTTTAGATSTTEAEAALPDLGGRTVTVGVENAYLPFNFILAGETEGQGWDYDAWRDICERLNCVPEFVEAAWPAVIDQVAQGEFDTAADGISITDERAEIVDYSIPYMVVQQKFIKQLGDDRFNSADDVINSDAIVATQVGTTNFELAADLVGEDRIQAFDQFGLAIQALIAGDVDVVIIDDAAGLGYIGENADQIETIDDPLQSDPLGFIYPQGSDLVEPVDLAIQAMIDDGTMEELGRTWFGPDFTVTYEDIEG
ncbi:MAG TPA: transporter substrate-binding domain-containing protein [Acidimicrobiia bacterium]